MNNNIDDFHSRTMGVMRSFVTLVVLLWFGILVSLADTHYVAQGGQIPAPDYTDWTTAASNIQDAIDISATVAGDTVLVSNGVYETGGSKVSGVALTNRVKIDKGIIVRSANNNPTNTTIRGSWASDDNTNGVDAVRCVYMVANSSLIGFTLTNGATLASGDGADLRGGGVCCALSSTNVTISNCVIIGNRSLDYAGGAYGGTLFNCTLISNSASGGTGHGGGAHASTMSNCTLICNSARYGGGGVRGSVLYDCLLVGNSSLGNGEGGGARGSILFNCTLISNAAVTGGGARDGTLSNCTLTANYASSGGGTYNCVLYNSTLTSNSAANLGGGAYGYTQFNCTLSSNVAVHGGGAYYSTMYNCTLTSNKATYGGGAGRLCTMYNCRLTHNWAAHTGGNGGGGAYDCKLYNCTITHNRADDYGGGTRNCASYNCIVYFNTAANASYSNWYSGNGFTNSCTAPAPTGIENTTANPMFVDTNAANYRLPANSACVDTGSNFSWAADPADVRGKDLDGKARSRYGGVDIGAYEHINAGTICVVR